MHVLRYATVGVAACSVLYGAAGRAASVPAATPFRVSIHVDAGRSLGPLRPVWRFFGADEPNYAYLNDGERLIGELGALKPGEVYFRAHNLLTTGDGTPGLKWGSTNAYREDQSGQAHLRLDDRRSNLRHVPEAWRQAVRRSRLHAEGALGEARAVSVHVDADRQVQRDLPRLDVAAHRRQEVGRPRARVGGARGGAVRGR